MWPRLLFLTTTWTALLHAEDSPVVGRIGEIELKSADVRETLAGLAAPERARLAKDPAVLGQYVRAMLVQRLVLSEARAKQWDQEPAVIARMVQARENAITESYLESVSTPDPGYPSESEIAEAYAANKAALAQPRTFLLAQIFINLPENADQEARARAKTRVDGIVKQLAPKSADFAAVARKHSDDTASAAEGGKIGWLTEAQIQPGIRTQVARLKLGAVSEPVLQDDGWHILKVLDIREARTPTVAEVREQLLARLRAAKSAQLRQDFLKRLLEEHPAAINEIELMKLP